MQSQRSTAHCSSLNHGAPSHETAADDTSEVELHPCDFLPLLPSPALQVPALQTNIAPLLNIKKDLLDVPKLASNVNTLQTSVASVQPLVGIKDTLLKVGCNNMLAA